MSNLPTALTCLTIEHVIDDVNAVEALLQENVNIERCISVALKNVLNMPNIPDANMTLKYLQALWDIIPINTKDDAYLLSATEGLTYLLPYIDKNPRPAILGRAFFDAYRNDHIDTAKYLVQILVNNKSDWLAREIALTEALIVTGKRGDVGMIKYILAQIKVLPKGTANDIIRYALSSIQTRYNYLTISELANQEDLNNIEQVIKILNTTLSE